MVLANLKKWFKVRFIPLLSVLIVLISCIPVTPVSASSAPTVSGFWELNSVQIRVGANFYQDVVFHCSGVEYSRIGVFPGAIYFYPPSAPSTGVNAAALSGTTLTVKSDFRLIYFPEEQQVSEQFYNWLQDNASPVVQTFPFEGVWQFDELIDPWDDLSLEVSFTCDEGDFESIYFDGDSLIYDGTSSYLTAWSRSSGWSSSSVRTIALLDTFDLDEDTWSWLHCNAVQRRDPSSGGYLFNRIVIGGDSFLFTQDEESSPDVQLSVTSTGAVLSSGSYRVKTWTYTGEGIFEGLYDLESKTVLAPGNSALLPGVSGSGISYNFDPAFSDAPANPDPDPGDQTAVLQAGQWECNSLVMTGEYVDLDPWPDGLAAVSLNFTSSGQSFSSMSGQVNPAYGDCLYYGSTLAYKYSDLTGTAAASWQPGAYSLVYLLADQEVPQAFYDWFTANFSRSGSDPVVPSCSTTVNIYDSTGIVKLHSITFSDTSAAPSPLLSVSRSGCTISYGNQSTSWIASGSFYGFALSPNSSAVFVPGDDYDLPGGQSGACLIDLYVASVSSDGFTTTIIIDGQVFQFSDPDAYPNVLVVPNSVKASVGISGSPLSYWIPEPPVGYSFQGFSLSPDSDVVDVPILPRKVNGVIIYEGRFFQGNRSDNVVYLYPVYSLSSGVGGAGDGSGDPGGDDYDPSLDPAGIRSILSRFFSIFVEPVTVFFNAEFIPGFSFSRVALVSLVLGLMFWLLHVTR